MTGPKSARSTTPRYASFLIIRGGPTAVNPLCASRSSAYRMIDCSRKSASPFRKKNRAPEIFAALSMSTSPRALSTSMWSRAGNRTLLGSPKVRTVTLPLSSGPVGTDSSRMFGQPHQDLPDPGPAVLAALFNSLIV